MEHGEVTRDDQIRALVPLHDRRVLRLELACQPLKRVSTLPEGPPVYLQHSWCTVGQGLELEDRASGAAAEQLRRRGEGEPRRLEERPTDPTRRPWPRRGARAGIAAH